MIKNCLQCNKEYQKPYGIGNGNWSKRKYCSLKCRDVFKVLNKLHKGENNPMYGKKISEETRLKMKSHKGEERYNYKGGYKRKLFQSKLYRVRKIGADGSHTQGEWDLLKIQYGNTCPCCKKSEPEIKLTEDHIIPLTKGGSNYIQNIQPLCQSCNCKKYTQIIKY